MADIDLYSRDFNGRLREVESVVIKAAEEIGYKYVGGSNYGEGGSIIKIRESVKWGFWNNEEITIFPSPNDSDSCTVCIKGKTLAEKLFQTMDALL